MSNNVIKFPKIKLDFSPQTLEDVSEKIAEYKRNFADELSEMLWNNVLGELARAGSNLDENTEELFPSMILLLESIKSLQLHANGVHHPLQDFALECFEDDGSDDDDDELEIEVILDPSLDEDATIENLDKFFDTE